MRSIIRILFFAAIGLSTLFLYGGRLLASLIPFACAGGLWLAYFLLYARDDSVVDNTAYFEPVSVAVGLSFVGVGIWAGIRFLPQVPTVLGGLFIGAVFVVFPIFYGVAVIRQQLRRPRRHPKA
jgi:hypothetical protein